MASLDDKFDGENECEKNTSDSDLPPPPYNVVCADNSQQQQPTITTSTTKPTKGGFGFALPKIKFPKVASSQSKDSGPDSSASSISEGDCTKLSEKQSSSRAKGGFTFAFPKVTSKKGSSSRSKAASEISGATHTTSSRSNHTHHTKEAARVAESGNARGGFGFRMPKLQLPITRRSAQVSDNGSHQQPQLE